VNLGSAVTNLCPRYVLAVEQSGDHWAGDSVSTVLEVIAQTETAVVVADMPMITGVLGEQVGMLWFAPFAFGPELDFGHQ
jgi:hypothetical protein